MTLSLLLLTLSVVTAVVTAVVTRRGQRAREEQERRSPPDPGLPPTTVDHAAPRTSPVFAAPPTTAAAPISWRPGEGGRPVRPGRYKELTGDAARAALARARRARHRGPVVTAVAGLLVVLVVGVSPVYFWFDDRTPPQGTRTTEVVVVGYDEDPTAFRSGGRPDARVAVVEPAVDGLDRVVLDYRWSWPDRGDTLEVWADGDLLRSTESTPVGYLVGGVLAGLLCAWGFVLWGRHRRREVDQRIAHFERQVATHPS